MTNLNRFNFGYRMGWNLNVGFKHMGAFPARSNPGPATGGAVNRGEPPWPFMLAELGGYLAIVFTSRLALLPLIDVHPAAGVVLKCLVAAYLVFAAVKLW